MDFHDPLKVYTAESNLEAQFIVSMLESSGVLAYADEDQTALDTLHRPNVWVDQTAAELATKLIQQFEEKKWERSHPSATAAQIPVICEECSQTSFFSTSLKGTIQVCTHCGEDLDVGEAGWEGDFGEAEE